MVKSQENILNSVTKLSSYDVYFPFTHKTKFFDENPDIQGIHDAINMPLDDFQSSVKDRIIPWTKTGTSLSSCVENGL